MNDPAYVFSHRLPLMLGALAAGYEVHVACPRIAPRAAELAELGVVAHEVPLERGLSGVRQLGNGLHAFSQLLSQLRPQVLHCVTLQQVVLGGAVGELHRVPRCVYSIHGLGSTFISKGWRARALRAALTPTLRTLLRSPRARTIVQNQDDADFLCNSGFSSADRVFLTQGSGVDTRRFCPGAPPPAPLQVVLGARMIADKGVREFVEAARLLRARGFTARFVLAGPVDPCNASALSTTQLRRWEAEVGVQWRGSVQDMVGLLQNAHIACLPSYREGLPKFLAEAAACGLPVVTTAVPGCRSAVKAGETGLTVPARDPVALAGALERLLQDAPLRATMGAAARRLALERFSAERVVGESLRVYEAELPTAGRRAPKSKRQPQAAGDR